MPQRWGTAEASRKGVSGLDTNPGLHRPVQPASVPQLEHPRFIIISDRVPLREREPNAKDQYGDAGSDCHPRYH